MLGELGMYVGGTGEAVLNPLLVLLNSFILFLPGLVAGIVVVIAGYIVASVLGWLLHKALDKVRLDAWMKKHKLHSSIGGLSISCTLSKILKWYIIIAFLIPAVAMLQLGSLSVLLRNFVMWLPHVISAVLIFLFGLIFADFAYQRITAAKGKFANLLGSAVKVVVVIFVAVIALQEIGIYIGMAEKTFLILITGFTIAVAIAVGIGLGYGLRKHGDKIVAKCLKKF